MVEYALPLAVCVVVVIALAWSSDLFSGMSTQMATSVSGERQGNQVNVASMGRFLLPPSAQNLPEASAGQESICFMGSGTCINMAVITPEVAGGLGGDSVRKLAATLAEMARMMKEEGVNPEIVDLVTRLANRGHGMGDQIKAIQALCSGQTTCKAPAADQARAQLADLKASKLDAFMADWATLENQLKTNPGALSRFPEAMGIIRGQVSDIQQLISSLKTEEKLSTVTQTTNQVVNTTVAKPVTTTQFKPTPMKSNQYTRVTTTTMVNETAQTVVQQAKQVTVSDGFVFSNTGAQQITRNANNICSQGGQTAGAGNCLRRFAGASDW
jgi:hypothetical protein